MSHVVVGGTGTVGSQLVRVLTERGKTVRVVTRSLDRLESLPDGVEGIEADMTDPTTFERAFAGNESMFLLNPLSPTELQEGLFALEEAKRAGVRHIVYLSVHDAEKGRHLPHFASKLGVEKALGASGIDWTVLKPNSYFQNDLWLREPLVEHGVYPDPVGSAGISRVDVRDIADAAANAFEQERFRNRTVALVGPETLTGESTAEAWSEALGRDVVYAGDDLEAWEQQARQMMPAWLTYDLRLMFELFQTKGLVASPAQLEETRDILGREPRAFGSFTEETAARWS